MDAVGSAAIRDLLCRLVRQRGTAATVPEVARCFPKGRAVVRRRIPAAAAPCAPLLRTGRRTGEHRRVQADLRELFRSAVLRPRRADEHSQPRARPQQQRGFLHRSLSQAPQRLSEKRAADSRRACCGGRAHRQAFRPAGAGSRRRRPPCGDGESAVLPGGENRHEARVRTREGRGRSKARR